MSASKITVYFDTRDYSKKNSVYPIVLRIYHEKKVRKVKSNYYSEKEHWIYQDTQNKEYVDGIKKGEILFVSRRHPNARRLNLNLKSKLFEAQQYLLNNESKLAGYPIERIKEDVQEVINNQNANINVDERKYDSITLIQAFKKKIVEADQEEAWGIKITYNDSLKQFIKYLDHLNLDDVELADIDGAWLDGFQSWYKVQPNSKGGKIKPNTINKRLNQLRHLIKRACNDKTEKMTWNSNPFNDYKLPKNKTGKRALDIKMLNMEELSEKFDLNEVANIMDLFRQINLERGTKRWHARNYLLFMWDCRGMDLVDLAFLTRKKIENGILEYHRTKVKGESLITIDLNEEALEVLELYSYKNKSPKDLIFPFMADLYDPNIGTTEELYKKYRDRVRYFNGHITKLAEEIGLDGVFTSKMIRHTWAQLGFNETGNRGLIGEGLGHGNDSTTRIYARDLDRMKLKNVNELITKRKSRIKSADYKLHIDLFQYFHRGKAWGVEPDEFKNRIVKKILSYDAEVEKVLMESHLKKDWNNKIDELTTRQFDDYDQIEKWLQDNLKQICERHDINLTTSKYV